MADERITWQQIPDLQDVVDDQVAVGVIDAARIDRLTRWREQYQLNELFDVIEQHKSGLITTCELARALIVQANGLAHRCHCGACY